jgi:hypothetical protein
LSGSVLRDVESKFICLAAESASGFGLNEGFSKESVLTESAESLPEVELLLHDSKQSTTAVIIVLLIPIKF